MHVVIKPSGVSGIITASPSKSSMQRACAAALLHKGQTLLHNPGTSGDDKAALSIIQNLGAEVEYLADEIKITSKGINPIADKIDCGESGLSVRMFTSIAALSEKPLRVAGKGSLLKRPMRFFDEVLPALGVQCKSSDGFLPLDIKGPLQPKNITIDGSLSSQYLTGLLFAYAAANAKDVTITVKDLNSKPYVDLTLDVLKHFNFKLPHNKDYKQFHFDSHLANELINQPIHYTIEGDWSGAAFVLVAGAIAGNVIVNGLDINSSQADRAILKALRDADALVNISETIEVKKSGLKSFHFDATDSPDLFPPLVAFAANCKGVSQIKGVNRLTYKESNRAQTLKKEFWKLGIDINLSDDLMFVSGTSNIRGAVVDSHGDHRIAMACAIAALNADDDVKIENAEAVNKSYPLFWEHLKNLQNEK